MKKRTKYAAQLLIVCYAVLLPVVLYLTRNPDRCTGLISDLPRFGSLLALYCAVQIVCWAFLLGRQAFGWWILLLTALAHTFIGTAAAFGLLKNPLLPQIMTNRLFDIYNLVILLILLTDRSPLKKKTERKRRRRRTISRRYLSSTRARHRLSTRRRRRRRDSDYYYD